MCRTKSCESLEKECHIQGLDRLPRCIADALDNDLLIARLSMAVKRLYRYRDDDGSNSSAGLLERLPFRWVVPNSELWARCREANRD